MRNPALAFALGAALAAPTLASPPVTFVDLDRPGILGSIARDNPAHYAKIVKVLEATRVDPCETLARILKAEVDLENVHCATYGLLTSFPPKVHVAFRIDDVHYSSNVAQPALAGRIVRLQEGERVVPPAR